MTFSRVVGFLGENSGSFLAVVLFIDNVTLFTALCPQIIAIEAWKLVVELIGLVVDLVGLDSKV